MPSIKIVQKLGLDVFKKLNAQVSAEGVHIVSGNTGGKITQANVLGRVKQVFNLGKKLDVRVEDDCLLGDASWRFQQLDGVFYLVRITA